MRNGVSETELAAAAVAPRVTLENVEASIRSEHFFTATQGVLGAAIDEALEEVPAALDVLTFCVLVLQNGYTVHGISACADPANYNAEIGRRLARTQAVNQIWPLLGYELKTNLAFIEKAAEIARELAEGPDPIVTHAQTTVFPPNLLQGVDRREGQAEAQPSAASPAVAEETTGTSDAIILETIAKTCHEANRAYCASLGDFSQLYWEDAPGWQRESAIKGVAFILENPNASPAASHESWLSEKEADGWKWGPEKDPVHKIHPCFVPYDQLPQAQKSKDYIFGAIVRAMASGVSRV